jgi:ABC-type nitrate/sulfonate/bicarbonate transport system ATPase subunit
VIAYTKHERLLTIDKVSLTLGGKLILREVSAEVDNISREGVQQGQVICFLGPSGIGKTRLSRLIAGLDQPTSGTITLTDGQPTRKGVVGMVPQKYTLFDFATVQENFEIALRQRLDQQSHVVQQMAATSPYINEFGLRHVLGHYPHQLSGGQRQRVAIVRQLLTSEHFLVMDEPFSGLDVIMKKRACDVIAKVAQMDELNTIIIVTHDVTEGMSVADTVWLMGLEQEDYLETRRTDGTGWKPGARIVEKYDLAAQGLAWRPDIHEDKQFLEAVQAVKARFQTVMPT